MISKLLALYGRIDDETKRMLIKLSNQALRADDPGQWLRQRLRRMLDDDDGEEGRGPPIVAKATVITDQRKKR